MLFREHLVKFYRYVCFRWLWFSVEETLSWLGCVRTAPSVMMLKPALGGSDSHVSDEGLSGLSWDFGLCNLFGKEEAGPSVFRSL